MVGGEFALVGMIEIEVAFEMLVAAVSEQLVVERQVLASVVVYHKAGAGKLMHALAVPV